MTTATQAITSAFRESQLVAIVSTPTTAELSEGLALLNQIEPPDRALARRASGAKRALIRPERQLIAFPGIAKIEPHAGRADAANLGDRERATNYSHPIDRIAIRVHVPASNRGGSNAPNCFFSCRLHDALRLRRGPCGRSGYSRSRTGGRLAAQRHVSSSPGTRALGLIRAGQRSDLLRRSARRAPRGEKLSTGGRTAHLKPSREDNPKGSGLTASALFFAPFHRHRTCAILTFPTRELTMKIKIAITIEIDEVANVRVSSEDHQLLERIEAMAETQEQAVARLTSDVQSMQTVEQSAKTLLQGLADQLRANQGDPAAISALADAVEAQIADLSNAVTTNTPGQSDTGGTTGSDTSGSGTTGSDTTGTGSGDGGAGADLPPPDGTSGSDTSGSGGDVTGGAAPAGATEGTGTSAIDPTVDAGAGADATAAQQENPAP